MHILKHINEDLRKVQLLIHKNFMINIKSGNINNLINQEFNYLDANIRPAIVIISNRLFGPINQQTIALAAVLQFIYMASQVHLKLKEGSSNKDKSIDNRTAYQLPVLVGDYLYGKFFTNLCDFGISQYLRELAQLICIINKNDILNIRYPDMQYTDAAKYIDIVRGETAELFAYSAYLGADLAGAAKVAKDQLYNFGLNLGMAYALLERGASVEQIKRYLTTAESIIKQSENSIDRESLLELLDLLSKENAVQRMVV